MITNKQIWDRDVVGAEVVPLFTEDLMQSRFSTVIDSKGHECGAVTRHYKLITNGALVAAADLASDELGIDLVAGKSRYYKGRAVYTMYMPDEYRVPTDPSGLRPQIELGNSYGGKASILGKAGVYRLVCTNGMTVGEVIRADAQRHIGEFDLYKFVKDLMVQMIDRAEAHKLIAEVASETEFNWEGEGNTSNREYLIRLVGRTPKKYSDPLHRAIVSNTHEMGRTVWAILQAISEVSTHDMTGMNADDWQRRETNRLLETVNIGV